MTIGRGVRQNSQMDNFSFSVIKCFFEILKGFNVNSPGWNPIAVRLCFVISLITGH